MAIWAPKVGDKNFNLKWEDGNKHNKYFVAVTIGGSTGGHVPNISRKVFNLFLAFSNCTIKCKVTGKRINGGVGYGLEIPFQYNIFGPKNAVDWTKKCKKSFEKRTKNCIK